MVHDAITNFVNPNYCVLEEVSAQIPSWDKPIPRSIGDLKGEVVLDTTHVGLKICTENFAHVVSTCVNIFVVPGAQNFCSVRGTELL